MTAYGVVGRVGVLLLASAAAGAQGFTVQGEAVPDAQPVHQAVEGQTDGQAAAPRVARLTYVAEGVVTVDGPDSIESVVAVQNMPLTQGMRVKAAETGQAEIEFEDGSVVRMTPNSSVRLDSLTTDGNGNASTRVRVLSGLVYAELRAAAAVRFRIQAGADGFWPLENATVRVNMDDPPAVISVLDGRVRVEHVALRAAGDASASESINGYMTNVRAGESLRSDATDGTRYFLNDRIVPESWDNWNEARDQAALDEQGTRTAVRDTFAGNQGYGWADLDANGTWFDQNGEGPVWQPYEALQAGFDPYGAGSWSYVGGYGYGWASGYRWGWTPFRCGRWDYYDGFGWVWRPDTFCRTRWGYGGHYGGYVGRAPKNYVPPIAPIKHPVGVHPIIVKGPGNGAHPPYLPTPGHRPEPVKREIAGVTVTPIKPVGPTYTSRGGSAVGWGLKRDYAVDDKTKAPVVGIVSSGVRSTPATLSSGPGWHAVATRPEPPVAEKSGGFRGIFHTSKPAGETPVVMDRRGNPVVQPSRAEQQQQQQQQQRQSDARSNERGQQAQPGVQQGYRSAPSNTSSTPVQTHQSAPAYSPPAHVESHSAPAASYSPPPSPPPAPAPAAAAPAASSHK